MSAHQYFIRLHSNLPYTCFAWHNTQVFIPWISFTLCWLSLLVFTLCYCPSIFGCIFTSDAQVVHASNVMFMDMYWTFLHFCPYRRLAKSTFLLVALFGLYYILFAFLPHKLEGLSYIIWNFTELALASTQVLNSERRLLPPLIRTLSVVLNRLTISIFLFKGFVVAVLYCFLNGEVLYVLHQTVWNVFKTISKLETSLSAFHFCWLEFTVSYITTIAVFILSRWISCQILQ